MRIELLGLPSEVDAALTALRAQLSLVSVIGPEPQRTGPLVTVDIEARMPDGPAGWMAMPTGHVPKRPEEILRALGDRAGTEQAGSGSGSRRPRRVGGGGRA